jgi:hypothetical protein
MTRGILFYQNIVIIITCNPFLTSLSMSRFATSHVFLCIMLLMSAVLTSCSMTIFPISAADVVSDSGFNVKTDGFAFENYTSAPDIVNLTSNDMRRLFGDKACIRIVNNDCTVTPPVLQWMNDVNAAMENGHCEGMAVTSLHLYHRLLQPSTFGGTQADKLSLTANQRLQSEIAYWWATQRTMPTYTNIVRAKPSQLVKLLADSLRQGQNATVFYTVGIYMRDMSGGHAVTPVSITDLGNNLVGLNIYDNNYPQELRTITVDLTSEKWSYAASDDPNDPSALYEGDAESNSLEITPSQPRLEVQNCDFCDATTQSAPKGNRTFMIASTGAAVTQPAATTVFVTPDGKRLGYVDGVLINEITGASVTVFKGAPSVWDTHGQPVFTIPAGITVTLQIQHTGTNTFTISAYGNGSVVKISQFTLSADDKSDLAFGATVGSIQINSTSATSPTIYIGAVNRSTRTANATQMTNLVIPPNSPITIAFDPQTNSYSIKSPTASSYDLEVRVSNQQTDYLYTAPNTTIPRGRVVFTVTQINSNDATVTFNVDSDDDGSYDDQSNVSDQTIPTMTATPIPSVTPIASVTPIPTDTAVPPTLSATLAPSTTPRPSATTIPTATPIPTDTVIPSEIPTTTAVPTDTVVPTDTAVPAKKPNPTTGPSEPPPPPQP